MKFVRLFFSLFIITGVALFNSCDDEDKTDNKINSKLRLLPHKISTEYGEKTKLIYTYKYDDQNRLTEYTETSLFVYNVNLEDMETNCRIIYNRNNEIDSLIISPRLLDSDRNNIVSNDIYLLVNDTILFKHEGGRISIKYRNKDDEYIHIDSEGKAKSYIYRIGREDVHPIVNTFEYDAKGNILRSTINNGIDPPYSPYTYIYDKRNGIFSNINIPQWFITIMLNHEFNMVNNYLKYIDDENGVWDIQYEYNDNDYPIYLTTKYSSHSKINASEAPTTIEYIVAR